MTSGQLPLDLPHSPARSRDDLIVGPSNMVAAELIDMWPDWPGSVVVLAGPPGSGKSFLAGVWSGISGAGCTAMANVGSGTKPPDRHWVFEDALPGRIDEEALFHILNHMHARNLHCLITALDPPSGWGIALADLRSRLGAAQFVRLAAPDDAMLRMVIVKLLADRQLSADPGVVEYLVNRMERSLDVADRLVAEIDRQALARGQAITRRLAASALAAVG